MTVARRANARPGVILPRVPNPSSSVEDHSPGDKEGSGKIISFTEAELTRFVENILSRHGVLPKDGAGHPRGTIMETASSQASMEVDVDKWQDGMEASNQENATGYVYNKVETDQDDWHSPFGESTYTLVYVCHVNSQAYWYAIFVYLIQVSTILLTLLDVIDWGSDENSLKTPPMVDPVVSVAQAVALFLAIAYQPDLIEAVLKLHEGYFPELLEDHPGATFFSWLVSCVSQLFSGLLLLTAIFVLTMQVDSVLAMMLNFAALTFIAEIDDLGFYMANKGFVTNKLQEETEAVVNFKVPNRNKGNAFRRILYYLTLIGLFIGFGILKSRQLNGAYLPTYLGVQFGDARNHKISYYSGVFFSTDDRVLGHREYRDLGTETILLAYCNEEKAWTFSETDDPCDFFAKSPPSNAYDVTSIPSNQWLIKDSTSRFAPFESFSLVNQDCDVNVCKGTCVEGLCSCPKEKFGLDCEFGDVCPTLVVDGILEQFPISFEFQASDTFELFYNNANEPIKAYNMPVYYSNKTFPASVIFFGGHRWVLASEEDIVGSDILWKAESFTSGSSSFSEETAEVLQSKSFHGHHKANHKPYFLSDPVIFGTPDFQPAPSGLGWSVTAIRWEENQTVYVPTYPIETVLQCQTCFEEHGGFCDLNGGVCNSTTGRCDCFYAYFGARCEMQVNCYDQERPCEGHGSCGDDGTCHCHLPFGGKLCEALHGCSEEDYGCFNGGICNRGLCDCPDPATFGGFSCESREDCAYFGCRNGGACNEDTGICDCQAPFHGFLCDLVDESLIEHFCSDTEDCFDGTCDSVTGMCVCQDPSKHGSLCEHQHNCTKSGCKNFGKCNDVTELCECEEPFVGFDCADVPDCSTDADCLNGGGVCDTEYGWCRCSPWAASGGKLCHIDMDCRVAGCSHAGICGPDGFCECQFPYIGPGCNYILTEAAY